MTKKIRQTSDVIITVPHATCGQTNESLIYHTCDILAPQFAELLHRSIKCTRANMFIGDINRDVVDLNRKEGRDTHFRKRVARQLSPNVILVDVHSNAPDSYNYGKYDVSIISKNSDLKNKIYDELIKSGYRVGLFNVHEIDDILIDAERYGVNKSILIEINEKHRNNQNLIEDIAEKIGQVICEVW